MNQIKRVFYRWLNSESGPGLLLFVICLGVASFGMLLSILAVPY